MLCYEKKLTVWGGNIVPNYLDDFLCERSIEEFETEYISQDAWNEVEYYFCEELELEPECYED